MAGRSAPGRRRGRALTALLLAIAAPAFAGQYGPGPETFPPAGRFVFRHEAEAVARKVAATRGLAEPVNVVEVRAEATSMTPGGRGWSVVVVGRVTGGCHAVTVGLAAEDGRVYAIADRRVTPEKPPPDCERWYILGGAESATATLATAANAPAANAIAVVTPKPVKGGRTLTREEVLALATAQAAKKGYTETEVMMAELRPGEKPVWRADLVGATPKGCGIYKIELTGPDWKMRFQNNQMSGKKVQVDECRRWYDKDGREEAPTDWLPGRVEWTVIDSDNLQ